jgi:hypothetical protein
MSFISAYIDAFHTAYPQKRCEVRRARAQGGNPTYRVGINGDFGDRIYSELELHIATRAFQNGAPTRSFPRATAKLGDIARFVN